MSKLLKDLSKLLDDVGLTVEDGETVSQIPGRNYTLVRQVFRSREVLVPLMTKLAIGIKDAKNTVRHIISYKGEMLIVKQFLQNIVEQFLNNLKEKELIPKWCQKDDCCYEIYLPEDEENRRFFRSEWAEYVFRHVIMKTVQKFCKPNKLSHKILPNVKLRHKEDNNLCTELDLVVQVEDRFYVFEVKSGPHINIVQWAKREMLLVQKTRNVRNIVCTIYDSIPEKIFEPQLLWKLNNMESKLIELLETDFPQHG